MEGRYTRPSLIPAPENGQRPAESIFVAAVSLAAGWHYISLRENIFAISAKSESNGRNDGIAAGVSDISIAFQVIAGACAILQLLFGRARPRGGQVT
ncbi:hypothetical protein [Mycoplana dimorpha]|uniref:Uncharacterized protein n=1 Tax=Mycoplana dimorpha TaxID=28320 RepID=A0A2T5B639_MYCDI|nr:hypothetical protein [Mycoplana dimorpha]PTM94393.1 hypothetical protein C7449_105294 [Mycoplana dimorpha]